MNRYHEGDEVRLVRWYDLDYEEYTDTPPYGVHIGDIGTVIDPEDSDGQVVASFTCRDEDGETWDEDFYFRLDEIEPLFNDGLTPVERKIKKLWEQSNYYKKVNRIENTDSSLQNGQRQRETVGTTLGRDLQYVAGLPQQTISSEERPSSNQLGVLDSPPLDEWFELYAEQYRSSLQLSQQTENLPVTERARRIIAGLDNQPSDRFRMDREWGNSSLPPNGSREPGSGNTLGPQYGGIGICPSVH